MTAATNRGSENQQQQEKIFEPLPEADYLLSLKSVEDRKSKKGDDMVTVVYEVMDGDHKGRLIYDNFLVTCAANADVPEFARNRVNRLVQALGVTGGFDELNNDYSGLTDYLGKPFIGSIAFSKPYKGKDGKLTIGNRVKAFNAR